MTRIEDKPVLLSAMSARQRRLVEWHLPLVRFTLRRCGHLAHPGRSGREPNELLQEGCLALVEAVRTHDPTRHGRFASFAMARIHYAMSCFVHEQQSPIRIPFITQRRSKKRQRDAAGDRHRPDALPRVVPMSDDPGSPGRDRFRRLGGRSIAGRREDVTIGDLIRECYDRAALQVASQMKNAPRCTDDLRRLIDRCSRERWTVPEPEARTPIRRLARTLGCSMGRITHCEERFRRRVATVLEADPIYRELLRMGRRHADGWRHPLAPEESAHLRRQRDAGR